MGTISNELIEDEGKPCSNGCMDNFTIIKCSSLPAIISIIVPTYNRWELLIDSLESVFEQTFPDWEAVIVNDAGTKPEEKMVQILNHPRITYVEHKDNKGLACSRNTGIDCSRGEFIAYLDDDDIYYPNHLEVLLNAMYQYKWDIAYTDAYKGICTYENGKYTLVEKILEYSNDYSIEKLWRNNFIPVNCVMHRRDCLDKTGNFDINLKVLEDWDLWLRMSLHYNLQHLPIITAEYRVRNDKTNMSTNTTLKTWNRVKYDIYIKYICREKMLKNNLLKKEISKSMYGSIKEHIKTNGRKRLWKRIEDIELDYIRLMTMKWKIKMFINRPHYIFAIMMRDMMKQN